MKLTLKVVSSLMVFMCTKAKTVKNTEVVIKDLQKFLKILKDSYKILKFP